MTDDRTLLELVEKDADSDPVRDLLAFAAGRLMETEVEAATGTAKGASTASRTTQRNATASGPCRRGPGGSIWRSRSCARAATFPAALTR